MMKKLTTFDLHLTEGHLSLMRGQRKTIPVEVLVDGENTVVVLNCTCCKELLASRLPGGVLIPIASSLKTFFQEQGMRNVDVAVSGDTMKRTYRGVMDKSMTGELKSVLEDAVTHFTKKKRD